MKLKNSGKTLIAAALVGAAVLGTPLDGNAQYGGYGMGGGMGGGMMGGYGRGMMGGYGGGMNGGYGSGGRYGENQRPGYSDLNSRAGREFAQTCSQCHPLPDARQHTAQQWPGVIARMEQHMRERNLPVPGDNAIKDIEAFLAQQTQGRR